MDATKMGAAERAAKVAALLNFEKATGATNPLVQTELANQVLNTLWLPPDITTEKRIELTAAALALMAAFKPQNAVEGMLVAQMFALHSAAMECLRRAMFPEQSPADRDVNLRYGIKLSATFARLLEVLDRRRGNGQRQQTVKHINVQSAEAGTIQPSSRSTDPGEPNAPSSPAEQSAAFGMESTAVQEPVARRA